jgi:colanic acid/amylovoran biosynthesis glycosyltransferase
VVKPKDTTPIAFLFPAFPVLHQTFVMWEVMALRQHGIPIVLYSIKRPGGGVQQPEAAALARQVHYLPSTLSVRALRTNVRVFIRSPRRYLGACALLIREWWRDRRIARIWQNKSVSTYQGERVGLLLRTRINRFFNYNQFLFLLKSLWLVPVAVTLGAELQVRGIRKLHAHWASYPATVALVIRWIFDIPFSFTAHAYDIYLVPRLLPVKVRMAEFVVTCAQVNARSLQAVAGPVACERVVVNYHGVDLTRFHPGRHSVDNDPPCIVSCGSLELYKGHHVLLRACALLRRPVRCIIIGIGPLRQYLQQLADSLGIGERVVLAGALPQAQVAELYAKADLFVLASVVVERFGKRDVIPNVLVEAMAMQVPVVATNVSGISELITDGVSGRLAPPNDPRALAAIIGELLDDEAQRSRLALAGYDKVVRDFDRATNVPALAALFAGMVPRTAHLDGAAVVSNAVGDHGSGGAARVGPCAFGTAPPAVGRR